MVGDGGGGGGGSQRLLSLNPITVMAVLLLEFWLLLGCDNFSNFGFPMLNIFMKDMMSTMASLLFADSR